MVFAEFEVSLNLTTILYVVEVLGAHIVVSKLSVCAPRTSKPIIRDMYGRIESVQGLVHFATSTLYFRLCLRVATVAVSL
jgi:hypothetical protein